MLIRVLVVILISTFILYLTRRVEGYGVFSHRGTLHGIKNRVRSHYTLQELDYQNPSDYWTTNTDMSIHDKHIQRYHSKRFDPNDIQ